MGMLDGEELEGYLDLRDPKMKRSTTRSRAGLNAGQARPLLADVVAEAKRAPHR